MDRQLPALRGEAARLLGGAEGLGRARERPPAALLSAPPCRLHSVRGPSETRSSSCAGCLGKGLALVTLSGFSVPLLFLAFVKTRSHCFGEQMYIPMDNQDNKQNKDLCDPDLHLKDVLPIPLLAVRLYSYSSACCPPKSAGCLGTPPGIKRLRSLGIVCK